MSGRSGRRRTLRLGNGIRFNSNVITIDIDESKVIPVKIQHTYHLVSNPWISTANNKLVRPGLVDNFKSKCYAIVPETLPSLSKMDRWGRQDIESQAEKQSPDATALYDLVLLRYSEIEPRQPCYDIVQDTMRIVSLGKFLDSRRPIDHDKVMDIVEFLIEHPPSQFGIKEFNRYKADFQLSTTARTQLYILAAQEIVKTQVHLGAKLDDFFGLGSKMDNPANVFLVGACLRRLGLEYRQRLARYRLFPSHFEQLRDRIDGCLFMYTLFTRLYDLWYRGRERILPISDWDAMNFSHILGNDSTLIRVFEDLGHLEKDFGSKPDADDKFYRTLIRDRAFGKSLKV